MQTKFDISVVIPNYNRAELLVNAINSTLNQTYPVLEILICDDGSTDNSKEKVLELNNEKIKWIDCGKNGRPAIPRNIGINNSKGNWIAFLDNDDTWQATKIEKQVKALQQSSYLICCTNALKIKNNVSVGEFSNFNKNLISLSDLMKQNEVICSSVIVNKNLLLSTSLFPEDITFKAIEDYALWVRLSTKSEILYLNENLVNYTDAENISIRSEVKSDGWDTLNTIFYDFKNWFTLNKISLSKENQLNLKILYKKIKQRGVPTAYEEFIRKLKSKFNL
ncbi:MAG: glycosyltransferase family 2 protein [Bacteroidetes bacterium]|nr:glycosyltransferase family 2 protein [Bacteroidota bacterium]